MPNPVSLLVWRDAKTDPFDALPETQRIMLRYPDGRISVGTVGLVVGFVDRRNASHWAELPVVSDLTDEDLEDIKDMAEAWLYKVGASLDAMDRETVGRLRAALGGKEEA